jgi:selenocysteine-specific elongation factor
VAINPPRRTRKRADTLHALTGLTKATPEERLLDILARQPADTATLAAQADMPRDMVERTLRTLRDAGRVVGLAGERPVARTLWTVPTWLADTTGALLAVLGEYHRRHPLQRGMRGEEARACLGLERAPWNEVAAQGKAIGMIGGEGNLIWAAEHRVVLDPAREAEAMAFLDRLTERPYAPSENGQDLDPELLRVLLDRGDPVCLAPGVLLRRNAYTEMVEAVLREIDEGGMVSVGTLRDRFGTSRKFALALLEHLDDRRLTRRVGDGRVRGSAANR